MQVAVSMPGPSCLPVDERSVAGATEFDLSDVDEVDIGGAEPAIGTPRRRHCRERADLADDVLATCALLVFMDRRRRARYSPGRCVLPGL